jgi:hypothetical protein
MDLFSIPRRLHPQTPSERQLPPQGKLRACTWTRRAVGSTANLTHRRGRARASAGGRAVAGPSSAARWVARQRGRSRAARARKRRVPVEEVFEETRRRDPECRRRWVVLVDGDRHQIARVRAEARRRGLASDITLVVDFIHVLEYLWDAAWCFFAEGDRGAERCVTERAFAVLQGRSSDVTAGIRRSATLRELPADRRKGADDCADYLIAKRSMLRYDRYLRAGLPIATGVIEGACRHLIVDRLDITGARWSVPGAEAILRLRSLRPSGDSTRPPRHGRRSVAVKEPHPNEEQEPPCKPGSPMGEHA